MMKQPSIPNGFTLIEVAIGVVLFAILLGAALSTIDTGQQASKQTISIIDLDEALRITLHKMADEVRWSSRQAEDTNDSDSLDDGEDTNGNGRFEDDWSLTASSMTFNMRSGSGFGLPITYQLNGDVLEKIVMLEPSGQTTRITLLKGVTAFELTEAQGCIKVNIAVSVVGADGGRIKRSQSISITPRN